MEHAPATRLPVYTRAMSDDKSETNQAEPQPHDKLTTTRHSVTVGGQSLNYTVTTGTLVLKEEATQKGENEGVSEGEKPKAEVFFIAYTKDEVEDPRERPVTFSFNGGPGSSSVWLHLGLLGPRRVDMRDTDLTPPPYGLTDNEFSLLDETDLVFIDPVGTGYSRAVTGEKAKDFHTFKKDIQSVGDFIRLYTTRYGRWGSPKFLAGESYGTTRAAGLAGYLQERHGLYLNGLMLVSVVLDFTTLLFNHNNVLPNILYLPTYAATAWYHQKLGPKLQGKPLKELLNEVEAFTLDEYAPALLKGSSLGDKERRQLVRKLARYTGLSEDYIGRTNLRIGIMRFTKELLRGEGRTVGRLDSRFTGTDRDHVGEVFEFDPSLAAITGPYAAAFNHYVREELGYESDLPYEILSFDVNKAWQWETDNAHVDVAETLRKAMTTNPHLKVHVASGYYDLATPHFATEYTFNHLGLPEALQGNVTLSYYEAGHMMYVNLGALEALKTELARFVRGAGHSA